MELDFEKEFVERVQRPLVSLCIAEGLGYDRLSESLKRLFIEQAQQEMAEQGNPEPTRSMLGTMAGLSTAVIKRTEAELATNTPSLRWHGDPVLVLTHEWALGDWPACMPIWGQGKSFASLVKHCRQSTKSMGSTFLLLRQLQHRRCVRVESDLVIRIKDVDVDRQARLQEILRGLETHVQLCVRNLKVDRPEFRQLEQMFEIRDVDLVTSQALQQVIRTHWRQLVAMALKHPKSIGASLQQSPAEKTHVRFGIYFNSDPIT